MAHSPFLQDMARRHNINLNLSPRENKLLVCRYVLESLEQYFFNNRPALVLPAIGSIESYLRALYQEFQIMHHQKELDFFLHTGSIKSISGIERNLSAACDHAYAAGEAHRDQNYSDASSEVTQCHQAIKKALGTIVIR